MVLYYTGASNAQANQQNPHVSLGGFVSSTVIPNSMDNALFSDIALQEQIEGSRQTRAVALKNTTGAVVTDLYVWTIPDNDGATILVVDSAVLTPLVVFSGASGENVKMSIPLNTVDLQLLSFLERFEIIKFSGGDKILVSLEDGVSSVTDVPLHVKSSVKTASFLEINFLAPDYTDLGLDFSSTAINTVLPSYDFLALDRTDETSYEMAPVSVSNQEMEKITDERALPYTGTFLNVSGEGNKVLLTSSFPINAIIGLWLKRTIVKKVAIPCEDLEESLENQNQIETFLLSFDYN